MNYIDFKDKFELFGLFSIQDIRKIVPDFYFKNLNYWQKKNYLIKLKNGWYCFPEFLRQSKANWLIANSIYQPSYVSLESILSFYGLIPDVIFTTTSVATMRTMTYKTVVGDFYYYTIKPEFYFGYRFLPFVSQEKANHFNRQLRIAELEKAILDFFYLRKNYRTKQDIIDLRFDRHIIQNELNIETLCNYLSKFKSKTLEQCVNTVLEVYQ